MNNSEVLTPILLRSSTPAPSEKVLLYLEGIQRSGGASPVRDSMMTESLPSEHGFDPNDPQLTARLNAYRNRASSQHRSSALSRQAYTADHNDNDEPVYSEMTYENIDRAEISSNIQEGVRSDIAKSERTASLHENDQATEPYPVYGHAPEDGPGPRHASYASSFGNLGPPRESYFGTSPTQSAPLTAQHTHMANGTPLHTSTGVPPVEPPSPHRAPWGQHVLRPTGRASAMSPRIADVGIDIEPPSDPSQASSQFLSQDPPHNQQRQAGITVNIGPDGSTTISIPHGSQSKPPSERAQTEKAHTERDHSEFTGDLRSPRMKSPKPITSVIGSHRPSNAEADLAAAMLSPGAQSRTLKSSRTGTRVPSRGPSKAPTQTPGQSQMSPISQFQPMHDFQSFGALQHDTGAPSTRTPSRVSQSIRVPSQRPIPSARDQSEYGTIPNDYTGDSGLSGLLYGRNGNGTKATTRATTAWDETETGWGEETDAYTINAHQNSFQTSTSSVSSYRPVPPPPSNPPIQYQQHQYKQMPPPLPLPENYGQGRAPSIDSRMSRIKSQTSKIPDLSPVPSAPRTLRSDADDSLATPTPRLPSRVEPQVAPRTESRGESRVEDEELNDYETEIVQGILSSRTPRTSMIAPSVLAEDVKRSQYHDEDLCILLHAADNDMQHEVVRKALRKAVAARIRKLGFKSDREGIKQYRKKFHDHDPSWHSTNGPSFNPDDPPAWAREMMTQLRTMENKVAALGPQLAQLKPNETPAQLPQSHLHTHTHTYRGAIANEKPASVTEKEVEVEHYGDHTPRTLTIPIGTQMTGAGESTFRPPETEYTLRDRNRDRERETLSGSLHRLDRSAVRREPDEFEDASTRAPAGLAYTDRTPPTQDGEYRPYKPRQDLLSQSERGVSPGQQVLEEELYRLRVKEQARSVAMTHQSWELHEESIDGRHDSGVVHDVPDSEIPDIEDPPRQDSPPLPPIPTEQQGVLETVNSGAAWQPEYHEVPATPPWQKIHQRLLNWAIVWPMSELDAAISSTQRGSQADEVALSIWSTQMYKRYVRQQLTEVPPGRVDRLFVPPNMADAINNAVFHGRHGDACGMLRDLWTPFGLEGMPRIIVVLCKHRSDPNHWVSHKFSLPDGTLTTYDTYPEKCLPDGRPLGWWFAIRIAWPGALYPSPDHLMQKMVRLHRPHQLPIDNSVAAAGIWRNLLMGSRAERPVDLERLRDLIHTEVKNLRQRKEQGKLSVAANVRRDWNWDEVGA